MPVELFKVSCVTCKASLSVRNAALVGQIVACPKCNSMVQIVPPAEPVPVQITAPPATSEPVQAVEEIAALDRLEPATEIPEPGSVVETASASNVNFIIWSVASFVIGATLTGLFLVLRPASSDEQVAAAQLPATDSRDADQSKPVVNEPSQEDTEDQPTVQLAESNATSPSQVETLEADSTLLGPIEEPVAEVPPTEEPTVTTEPVTIEEKEPEPRLVIAPPQPTRVARKFDPLALDPEQLDLNAVTEAASITEPETDSGEDSEETPEAEVPPVNLPVKLNKSVHIASGSRSANVQLRKEIPRLSVKEMPLLDFLALATQLAGVPVSISPDQWQMAGILPGKMISIDVTSANLADAIGSALAPLHLEIKADGSQVIVRRQEADRVRSVDYPVDDLLGDRVSAGDIAGWIQQLVSPESWQGRGGEGTITVSENSLTVDQAQSVQYQLLIFLERIRLYKGLPLRSRYPERLLAAQPLAAGIADRLQAPTTFTFSHDTPLAEVFHHWQSELDMPIFVDWPALASHDLWPNSLVTCAIANEPWHAALDKILGPLNLGWRPAPGGALQITSRARVETEPQLEIYPGATWQGDSTEATVIHDPVNNLTYVRAPASSLRLNN